MADTRATTKPINRPLSVIKGRYKSYTFEAPWLEDYGTNLKWWGLYVRDGENDGVVARTTKDTEEAAGRSDWAFSTINYTITIEFESDFSNTVPQSSGLPNLFYDAVVITNDDKRIVFAEGSFDFKPRYTRDDTTDTTWQTQRAKWINGLCGILSDQRTLLLEGGTNTDYPTATTTSGNASSGATTITLDASSDVPFVIGLPIGIEQDDGTYHEAVITNVIVNDVYFDAALTDDVASGNDVYLGQCNHTLCGT